jgi:hypothetical protein
MHKTLAMLVISAALMGCKPKVVEEPGYGADLDKISQEAPKGLSPGDSAIYMLARSEIVAVGYFARAVDSDVEAAKKNGPDKKILSQVSKAKELKTDAKTLLDEGKYAAAWEKAREAMAEVRPGVRWALEQPDKKAPASVAAVEHHLAVQGDRLKRLEPSLAATVLPDALAALEVAREAQGRARKNWDDTKDGKESLQNVMGSEKALDDVVAAIVKGPPAGTLVRPEEGAGGLQRPEPDAKKDDEGLKRPDPDDGARQRPNPDDDAKKRPNPDDDAKKRPEGK